MSRKPKKPKIPQPKVSKSHKIVIPKAPESNKRWTFSFLYFRQIKKFGLDKSDSNWFVSLLNRIKDFSSFRIEEFLSNPVIKNRLRYHDIDWTHKNVPIKRSDLDWIPKNYLENEEEFPIVQFMISQALGRIVGFWDEFYVFNIVLLDPLHNIQPSKNYHYKVDDCSPLSCKYSSLLKDIEDIKNDHKENNDQELYNSIANLPTESNKFNYIACHLEDEARNSLLEKLETKSINHIIELGLLIEEEQ